MRTRSRGRPVCWVPLLALVVVAASARSAWPDVSWRGLATVTARDEAPALQLNRLNLRDTALDTYRARLFVDGTVSENVTVYSQFVIDEISSTPIRTYGLYAVFSNFVPADLSIEAGKIPTVFGTFGPRAYENKNPLAGMPLMYQYHTSLRADQVPLSPEQLVQFRGRGQYGVGYPAPNGGFTGSPQGGFLGAPIIYDVCWDFGVTALGTWRRVEYALGVTQGTVGVGKPGNDTNYGKQIVGRLGVVPIEGLRIAGSAASGPYLSRDVRPFLPQGAETEDYVQRVLGASVDWSYAYVSLIGEMAFNVFESPWISEDLEAVAWYLEGKYVFLPGAYVAGRFDQIAFGEIEARNESTQAIEKIGWDRDVQRIEGAIGYRPQPAVLLRLGLQLWDDDGDSWGTSHSIAVLQTVLSY